MATRTRRTTGTNGQARRGAAEPFQPFANGAPAPSPANGRDSSGRFVKGNPGGPGNPHLRRTAALRAALTGCVTEKEVAALGRKLYRMAMGGDLEACQVLLRYLVGKPVEVVDPDTVDSRELDSLLCSPDLADLADLMAIRIAPAVAAQMVRGHTCPDTAAISRRIEEARMLAEVADEDDEDQGGEDEDDAGAMRPPTMTDAATCPARPRPLDRLAAAPTISRPPPRYDDAPGSWHAEKRPLRNTS